MTIPILPTLAGLTFPVTKSPSFDATIEHQAVAGNSTTQSPQPWPIFNYELPYSALRGDVANAELQSLQGLFESLKGRGLPFHFPDPDDGSVTNQALGTGDGVTTDFGFVRTIGLSTIPVQDVIASGLVVKVAGVTQSLGTAYSILTTTQYTTNYGIRFAGGHIPGAAAVTATFSYYWLCRFTMSAAEFSKFMFTNDGSAGIWEASLKFKSVWQ